MATFHLTYNQHKQQHDIMTSTTTQFLFHKTHTAQRFYKVQENGQILYYKGIGHMGSVTTSFKKKMCFHYTST